MDFEFDSMSIVSLGTCTSNFKTDKVTINVLILLFCKKSLGADIHSDERLVVYFIIMVLLSYVECGA